MGNEFIPTLIQTTVWEAWTWEGIRTELTESLKEIIEKEDSDKLFTLIKDDIRPQARSKIKDVIADIKTARDSVIAMRDRDYQDIILAILDRC